MKRLTIIATIVLTLGVSFSSGIVSAAVRDVCTNSSTAFSTVCTETKPLPAGQSAENPITGPNGILIKVTHLVALIAGAAAVIIIIVSGFRYVISSGDANNVKRAKNALINGLIGLVVIVLANSLIAFVISKIK